MTAFYMFRLMSMTFFGGYRGPAWEAATPGAVALAAAHGTAHPADPHAHGQANIRQHEVTHGPADSAAAGHGAHDAHGSAHDDHGAGHGHWHGPHESPSPMTFPLMALAVGAIVAGFVGIPAALGGNNAIEQFLEPSFTAQRVAAQRVGETRPNDVVAGAELERGRTAAGDVRALEHAPGAAEEGGEHVSRGLELGLMGLSLLIAVAGIAVAYKFYVTSPEISVRLADQFAGAHRTLSNKYYVDEFYNATVINGTFASGRGLWAVDRGVVDGAVNGTSRLTIIGAWFSGLTDKTVVDGLVNLVGWIVQESSLAFRRVQTGLVQNYAMLMLLGIFAFVSVYLFLR
jgi:NADH-quinone oxidoreductase subunit L